jgi:hypothetical protein
MSFCVVDPSCLADPSDNENMRRGNWRTAKPPGLLMEAGEINPKAEMRDGSGD